jgi:hypothetical protein
MGTTRVNEARDEVHCTDSSANFEKEVYGDLTLWM